VKNVRIVSISTLLVNVAKDVNATAIVKGLRAVSDFESEMQMAQMNRSLSGVETLFLPSSPRTPLSPRDYCARSRATEATSRPSCPPRSPNA